MSLHFSDVEFERRRRAIVASMSEAKLDGLLLFNPSSHYWLTGYDTFGFCFFQCLMVKADGQTALLTRSADKRQAETTSNIKDIRIWKDAADANPANDLAAMLRDLGLSSGRLGVEWETQGLTAANGHRITAALGAAFELVDSSLLVTQLRLVKSDEELAYVRVAGRHCDAALQAAISSTGAGADEGVILARMHDAVFEAGGDYPGNPFIIGSGANALLCRYRSGRRKLDNTDQLTLEWAGVERQYHVAAMRTLVVGEPRPRQRELCEASKAALLACEAALRPGRTFGDVFAEHAKILDAHGLGEHRLNACGYSLGTVYAPCWMDWPMFYEGNPVEIAPGMVLFLHMIIMDSASGFAMCTGRTSLTTENTPECLSQLPLDMIVC